MVKALLLDKKGQNQSPAPMKEVKESFNYNQGNTNYRHPMMSDQIRPPGFPPVPNNQNAQLNQRNNQNLFIQNQNRGNNISQGPVCQPPVFQPPAYQAPAPQTQGVSKEDFSAYVKANDAIMRNMQTQGQNMQNQLTNLIDLITKFVNSNSASTSSSGTLPSNIIANLRNDLKAITTRSGVSYDGPQIPSPPSFLPKVVEDEPEATKDTVNPTNNESTENVQPQVVRSESTYEPVTSPIFEPVITSVSAPKPKTKSSIPYPSRRNDEKNRMAECLALADLGASINLMPFSVWKRLSLPDLTPTCMTLELVDRSISRPVGVVETEISLIDVFEGDLTLRVGKESITFNLDQTLRYLANYSDMTAKRIDVIDMTCEEILKKFWVFLIDFLLKEVDAFLAIDDDPTSPEVDHTYLDPEGDILLLEAFLNDDPSPPPNQENYMLEVRKELKICEAKSNKSSIDEPLEVKLKDLPPHLEYAFLEGDDKLLVIIVKDLSTFQRCMMAIFHDMIEKTMEVFMDVFSVFRNSFQRCLSHLKKMLKRAIISDRGTYFCNDQFAKIMQNFGVTHRLATPYHPQTSGQVEVSNYGLKRILERATAGDHRKVQLNEVRDQVYEKYLIYKEKTKRLHDSKIKDRVFNIGDRVLHFDSRLKIFSGKLKSRQSGPFTISQVYPYGTVELSQPDGPNFKVNGHRVKNYFGEDVPKLAVPGLQTFLRDH
nr:reverse transcriptase domain-containing protein [Tanacetum cinerariifolium]